MEQNYVRNSDSGGNLELPGRTRAPMIWHQSMGHKGLF